jgi:dTDP-4-amino-4,6-dideoxygalactose transaminase
MNEISAAMGLTNLEAIDAIIETNRKNYEQYRDRLRDIAGIKLVEYNPAEKNNYQYVVIELDPSVCRRGRDEVVEALHAENVIARKYFWPGCHRMEPYKSLFPDANLALSETERVSANVIVLPTGQQIQDSDVKRICSIIRSACGV